MLLSHGGMLLGLAKILYVIGVGYDPVSPSTYFLKSQRSPLEVNVINIKIF